MRIRDSYWARECHETIMNTRKLLQKIVLGHHQNIDFHDFVKLAECFGFELSRTKGSHKIFKHTDIGEFLNLQDVDGQVKPYQIKQFITLIEKYNLILEDV